MSVTFYPSLEPRPGEKTGRALLRCACETMEPSAEAIEGVESWPMCAACRSSLNVNNRNAADLLEHLGMIQPDFDPVYGSIRATDLVRLCKTRLGMNETGVEIPTKQIGRLIEGGRSADYLTMRTKELLTVATLAGDRWVSWS